ncbi:citrulline utilization hydrolase CtlX [Paucibacter sp. DJ2R-2]|uniref:citrulline utilization hydrolase CtlX n=1 Tax=Paucibacter sp. DJ2R-2 TaxID=2893558 RepID=UPI0021E35DE3|nr:arginine deiminase-related protein [Paucibacter sp. DJ2R-2]MCV2419715.1 arginine deiminase-related protein [Paucibacter sp. DJ4R-1]MCV2437382.1 arginine deiminase-related protein [Paucibacter sp. DJ2R-2]
MVRPHHFHPNPQTAADNSFQSQAAQADAELLAAQARDEVTAVAASLQAVGVTVHLFEDHGERDTPDAVFPNNWFSTHAGGHVAVYPMYSSNRRRERRADVIEMLKARYRVQDVIDYSGLEADGLFLEGTGAMVLDHVERVAYTARSNRADAVALERFCTHFNFEPMAFTATDSAGQAVYHTNVIMCIAGAFALVALEMIPDPQRRDEIAARLRDSGRDVIALSEAQINDFAGNALELMGRDGPVLALSSRAAAALSAEQRQVIERTTRLLPLSVPTIELAGGSVRCMLAGIHLTPR